MAIAWNKKNLQELETYLKEMSMSVSGRKKAALVDLCAAAHEI